MKQGANPINTRDEFMKQFQERFFPELTKDEAPGKLHELIQTGTVPEYVKEFTELRQEVPDIGDSKVLFAFMNGL